MNSEKQHFNNKLFWVCIVSLLLVIIGYMAYDVLEKKEFRESVCNEGYQSCKHSVSQRGAEYEQAILNRKERIPELAGKLVGYEAKWNLIWNSKEDFQKWTAEQICTTLYNPEENKQLVILKVKEVANDWHEIENGMAKKLGRPVTGNAETNGMPNSPTTTNAPDGLDKTVTNQMFLDLTAMLGSELAGFVCTRIAMSGGILAITTTTAWTTCGISLIAGVIVDCIISIITDPTPEIEKELNKGLEENASKMRNEFERIMLEALEKRHEEWN